MDDALSAAIAAALDLPLAATRWVRAGGGFTDNWRCTDPPLFVKVSNDGDRLAAEADGLAALSACGAFRVPGVLATGCAGESCFLVLEWLRLSPLADGAAFGRALAVQHASTGTNYGWHRDNTLGGTPQLNRQCADWPAFFAECRLIPQLERALRGGHRSLQAPIAEVLARLPDLLGGHRPPPSLLHGDLWSGNAAQVDGRPAVFDPAVHHGDAECDLAMAALFGGFPENFFAAYAAQRPPTDGWPVRRRLYQLYHLLNHVNLFGAAYLGQAGECARSLAFPGRATR